MPKSLLLVAGGYCIGDALKAADLIQRRTEQGWTVSLVVGAYAEPAWRFLQEMTTIPIASIEVAAETRYHPPVDYDDMTLFWQRFVQGQTGRHWSDVTWPCEEMDRTVVGGTMDGYDRVEWLRWEALHPPYRCLPLTVRDETLSSDIEARLPRRPWIGIQANTKTGDLKRIPAITEADYPWPVVAFGDDATYLRSDWIHMTGQPLSVVAACLRRCTVFVGIASAVTRLAAMLGVPTLMCHYCAAVVPNDGVSRDCLHGTDMTLPMWMELETWIMDFTTTWEVQADAAG